MRLYHIEGDHSEHGQALQFITGEVRMRPGLVQRTHPASPPDGPMGTLSTRLPLTAAFLSVWIEIFAYKDPYLVTSAR